jgi:hypothetical protein
VFAFSPPTDVTPKGAGWGRDLIASDRSHASRRQTLSARQCRRERGAPKMDLSDPQSGSSPLSKRFRPGLEDLFFGVEDEDVCILHDRWGSKGGRRGWESHRRDGELGQKVSARKATFRKRGRRRDQSLDPFDPWRGSRSLYSSRRSRGLNTVFWGRRSRIVQRKIEDRAEN